MRPATDALIVVDVQNDFCPGGALAVTGGHEVVPLINALMDDFQTVVLTQDWHPLHHSSFADNHPDAAPFDSVEMSYGSQILWPAHCVQGQHGAEFHPDLRTDTAHAVIRKGHHAQIDSYSAFFENDRTTSTGLTEWLRAQGVDRVVIAGLAADFCVAYSALDAISEGFDVEVRLDASRGIDLDGSMDRMTRLMRDAGIRLEG